MKPEFRKRNMSPLFHDKAEPCNYKNVYVTPLRTGVWYYAARLHNNLLVSSFPPYLKRENVFEKKIMIILFRFRQKKGAVCFLKKRRPFHVF